MEHIFGRVNEPLILEPEDWSEDEWATILKLFGMEVAEKIELREYDFEAFGIRKNSISEEDWRKAVEHLNTYIVEYAAIGFAGSFGLNGILIPLKKRYDKGERTQALYDDMMAVE